MATGHEDALSLHPELLSRRISEIDLTSRGPRDVLPEFRPIYPRNELLNLRSGNNDGAVDASDFKFDGVMTPPSAPHPDVPPASPADHTPALGGDEIEEGCGGGNDEDEGLSMPSGKSKKKENKKKNKKRSGAGKSKKGITGFEGL